MTNAVPTPTLKGFLEKNVSAIEAVVIGALTPERMVRLACAAASRDDQLAKCSHMSILRSLAQCASMGLEPFDGTNRVYLVPRWNKKANGGRGALEATCLVGYAGLIHLATAGGKVKNVEARVVYAKDQFEVEYGDTPRIIHKPTWDKDRGEIVAFYSVAFLPDGSKTFDVMPLHEVEAIRDRSKDSDKFSPWKTDFVEMGRKTVVRRHSKYLPKDMALGRALEIQAKTEAGEYHETIEGEVLRPGEIHYQDGPQMEDDGDGNRVFVWTKDDVAAFHTACDVLHDACLKAGRPEQDADEAVDYYDQQRRAGENPEKVLNRMAAKTEGLKVTSWPLPI